MAHELPELPYAHDALEPHIDAETMTIHHGKHHQAYVTNLNAAVEGNPELESMSALELIAGFDDLPESVKPAVRKHGGGHVNHSMFWTLMSPDGGGEPSGALADEINKAFGSFDEFKAAFSAAAGGVLAAAGPGWWSTATATSRSPRRQTRKTRSSPRAASRSSASTCGSTPTI